MKKIFLIILLIINFWQAISQEITVQFQFNKNTSFNLASEKKKFILKQNDKFSLFELIDIKDENNFKHPESMTRIKERDTITFFTVNNQGFAYLFKEQCYKDFEKDIQIDSKMNGFKKMYLYQIK